MVAKSLHLSPDNETRLKTLAESLELKQNSVINLLIENAQVEDVVRREPVARLTTGQKPVRAGRTKRINGGQAEEECHLSPAIARAARFILTLDKKELVALANQLTTQDGQRAETLASVLIDAR